MTRDHPAYERIEPDHCRPQVLTVAGLSIVEKATTQSGGLLEEADLRLATVVDNESPTGARNRLPLKLLDPCD